MTDLASMTRSEKLRLYDLIEEKKRRAREKKAAYKPNAGQLPVHVSKATTRLVISGNGAGKTASAANEALWAAQGYNPITKEFTKVPARVIVLLDHPEKVADVWLPEMRKWATLTEEQLHKRGKPYVCQITFKNGSEIIFMFHQQDPLLFESIELDVLICDEPPPRHIYIGLRRGGRKKGRPPKFLLFGTPITGSWIRTEILEPAAKGELPDTDVFKFGTIVNEANLAEGYIQGMKRVLSEKEQRIRLDGEFYDLEGLALAHLFQRHIHVIEPFTWPDTDPVVLAIDPHPAKAHHAVLLGTDPDGYLYVIDELREKAVPREFAATLKEFIRGYRVIDIVCDSLGSSEYTGGEGFSSFIEVLNDEGIRARPTTWDEKSDEDWIERIRGALAIPETANNFGHQIPKLRVFSRCVGVVHDIENVAWIKIRYSEDYKPKLDISNKDFLSCVKYALATNLTYNKHKAKIYRPIRGAETYGVTKRPTTKQFRNFLNKRTTSRKASESEDW